MGSQMATSHCGFSIPYWKARQRGPAASVGMTKCGASGVCHRHCFCEQNIPVNNWVVGKGLEEGWVHSLLLRCTKMSFVYVEQMKIKALPNKVPTANKSNRKPTHMIQVLVVDTILAPASCGWRQLISVCVLILEVFVNIASTGWSKWRAWLMWLMSRN